MIHVTMKIVRCTSTPLLLIAWMFSRFAGNYELPLNLAICLGAVFFTQRAVRSGDFVWASGMGVVVIVFSPLLLVHKIFLFIGYTVIATLFSLAAAFRPRALAVE